MKQSLIRLSSLTSSSFAGIPRAVIARKAGSVIAAIGRSSFAYVAFAAFAANATPRIPYVNDFATRTSGATPSDRWMETDYITGGLVRSVSSISSEGREPYNSATAYQDGWTMKSGYCRSSVLFTVADDGGNQGALVNANSSSYQNSATVAMQPFYNEFTDGVLKISVDIRTPAQTDSFNPANNAYALCAPVYKSTLDLAVSTFSAPMYFGPASLYDDRGGKEGQEGQPLGWFLRAVSRGKNSADSSAAYYGQYDSRNSITAGSWVRYEAVLDLDAGTYTATFANLGTAHPTPATAGGSAVDFRRWEGTGNVPTTFSFVNPLTEGTGGIAGLAFYVQGIKQATDAADAPMFDNIAVSWKAPGATDFVSVYENDFSTRRYRQVEPAGTTSGAYVPVLTTNIVQSSFYERANINNDYGVNESNSRRLVPDGAPYAGQDGWRRIGGNAPFTMVDPNKDSGGYGWENASVLRATGSDKFGLAAAPLGTTVSSGKVRLYFDMMMGVITNTSTSGSREIISACFLSGNDAPSRAYTSSASVANALQGYAACGGGTRYTLSKQASATSTRINNFGGTGFADTKGPKSASDETLESKFISAGRWGRYVLTLDIDARTYDYVVYQLSTTGRAMSYDHSSSSVIVSKTGLALASAAPASIDSVMVFSHGQANYNGGNDVHSSSKRVGRFPLFDNVRVCLVNDDGTDGTELYSCNFEYGYRMSVQNAASLVGNADREGADRWIRRGNAYGTISAIDAGGGDNVVVLDGLGWIGNTTRAGYAVQPIGAVTKNCASVDFAADIRPPECFARSSDCFAYVEVGGDAYAQGVYRPASGENWRSEPRIGFGFSVGAGANEVKQYTNVVITVQARDAETTTTTSDYVIDTSHWYRFRVKAKPKAGKFTVKVHDQGTAKPLASDTDGTLVATFEDLALPAFGGEGMTTFGLAGGGFHSFLGGGLDDPYVVLVNNLSVKPFRGGTVLFVR